ncbi:RDD family protein [Sulfurimonas sp. MAG313]|nr:RDD family protein [Sulfurimonas sp. MAG313]MDF1881823.1 RDD family protein [Sulfurimonas sp. MAG313]
MNDEIIQLLDREELVLANKKKRSLAFAIDEIILSILSMLILWDKISGLSTYEEILLALQPYILYTMAIKIIYHTFFVMQFSASPGKIFMKIRVLEVSSLSTPSLFQSLNRACVRVISELLFYAGFIWGLLDPLSQTWQDKTANTVVVDA